MRIDQSLLRERRIRGPNRKLRRPHLFHDRPKCRALRCKGRLPSPRCYGSAKAGRSLGAQVSGRRVHHLDQIYPTRLVERAMTPWKFKCARAEIDYEFRGNRSSPADYVSRNPVTGLLIAKDDQILFEHYQYA